MSSLCYLLGKGLYGPCRGRGRRVFNGGSMDSLEVSWSAVAGKFTGREYDRVKAIRYGTVR